MTIDPDHTVVDAGPVSRAQMLDAVEAVEWRDVPPRWRGVLVRARSLAEDITGLDVALAAIAGFYTPDAPGTPAAQRAHRLDPDKVPTARTADGARERPGVHLSVSNATALLRTKWTTQLYRYAQLAQAVLDAMASDDPDAQFTDNSSFAHLTNELPAHPTALEMQLEPAPRLALPTRLALGDPAWLPVEAAMARVAAAEFAAVEYDDLTTDEDPDTGEPRFCLAEHHIDTAAELEDDAEDWPHAAAQFADTVIYILATRPDLLPASEQPN